MQQVFFAGRVGSIAMSLKARDDRIAILIRIVYVEIWVIFKILMEGQAQQTLFIASAPNAVPDIEECRREDTTILNDENASGLFDDEHAA